MMDYFEDAEIIPDSQYDFQSEPPPSSQRPATPPQSNPAASQPAGTPRQALLKTNTTLQTRKRRSRPVDVDGEIAEDDQKARKLSRLSRWQIFLYQRHLPEKECENIRSVYGNDIDETSLEYSSARQRLVDDQKNFKCHVLADMERLIRKHAEQPAYSLLLDKDVQPSASRLRDLAHAAWSPDNFFSVWKYMRGYVDYEKSSALGQYYMKHMFQGLALEVAKWIREANKSSAEGLLARKALHEFYFAMPKKAQFANVTKSCFTEIFVHQHNQKRIRKDDAKAEAAAHERFAIDEPPPPPTD